MRRGKIPEWICSLTLAGVFFAAAVPKILDPHSFAIMVFRYQLLPYALVNAAAICLPWIELTIATVLLWPGRPRCGAALLALVLLAIFVGAMLFNLSRGINVACGCFSVDPDARHNAAVSIIRDFIFVVLAAAAFWLSSDRADFGRERVARSAQG